jgi:hypothetical protein
MLRETSEASHCTATLTNFSRYMDRLDDPLSTSALLNDMHHNCDDVSFAHAGSATRQLDEKMNFLWPKWTSANAIKQIIRLKY